jgi:hypothetical protein
MGAFRTWLETREVIPIGDCFRFATKLATSMLADDIIPAKDIVVVHAIVRPKWHPREYPHAWVETRGRAHDWQMRQTKIGSLPIQDFYQEYSPDPVRMKRYTPGQAVGMMARSGHHGPWEI